MLSNPDNPGYVMNVFLLPDLLSCLANALLINSLPDEKSLEACLCGLKRCISSGVLLLSFFIAIELAHPNYS